MAKARLEKASLDDEIAELKGKNDELSQQNDKLEADNDEFQCPLHCAARASYASLAVGVVLVWIGRIACAPKGHHAFRNISQCVDNIRPATAQQHADEVQREGTVATMRRNANGTDTVSVVKARVSDWLQRWPRH